MFDSFLCFYYGNCEKRPFNNLCGGKSVPKQNTKNKKSVFSKCLLKLFKKMTDVSNLAQLHSTFV